MTEGNTDLALSFTSQRTVAEKWRVEIQLLAGKHVMVAMPVPWFTKWFSFPHTLRLANWWTILLTVPLGLMCQCSFNAQFELILLVV